MCRAWLIGMNFVEACACFRSIISGAEKNSGFKQVSIVWSLVWWFAGSRGRVCWKELWDRCYRQTMRLQFWVPEVGTPGLELGYGHGGPASVPLPSLSWSLSPLLALQLAALPAISSEQPRFTHAPHVSVICSLDFLIYCFFYNNSIFIFLVLVIGYCVL